MNGILAGRSKTIDEIGRQLDVKIWRHKIPDSASTVIRWGTLKKAPSAYKIVNRADAIKRASNKPLCRALLQQAGVLTPAFGTEIFPCIGRKRKHTGGRFLWFCETLKDVQKAREEGAVYFSAFYPKVNEYRIHIGSGKTILYSEKFGNKSGQIAWNWKSGNFVFRHLPREEWRSELIELAKAAINAVGLDFGAVDILADPKHQWLPRAVVCEINTAPALSEYGIHKYVQYFEKQMSG